MAYSARLRVTVSGAPWCVEFIYRICHLTLRISHATGLIAFL